MTTRDEQDSVTKAVPSSGYVRLSCPSSGEMLAGNVTLPTTSQVYGGSSNTFGTLTPTRVVTRSGSRAHRIPICRGAILTRRSRSSTPIAQKWTAAHEYTHALSEDALNYPGESLWLRLWPFYDCPPGVVCF